MRTREQKKKNAEASKRYRKNHPDRVHEFESNRWRKRHQERPEYYRAACRKWAKKNPWRRQVNAHQFLYHESIENKVARLEAQGYKCANQACLAEIDLTRGHQDHNHDIGENRGVLCSKCNHALGLLQDKAEVITGLKNYRERFS